MVAAVAGLWLPDGCHAVACGFIAVAVWLSFSSKWTVAGRLPGVSATVIGLCF
jgi:hypothetical protein